MSKHQIGDVVGWQDNWGFGIGTIIAVQTVPNFYGDPQYSYEIAYPNGRVGGGRRVVPSYGISSREAQCYQIDPSGENPTF